MSDEFLLVFQICVYNFIYCLLMRLDFVIPFVELRYLFVLMALIFSQPSDEEGLIFIFLVLLILTLILLKSIELVKLFGFFKFGVRF